MSSFRLAAFYFFYFASIGVFMPYWGKYLESIGYTSQDIGLLVGAVTATKIIAPYIWGVLSDRMGQRVPLIQWACVLAPLLFVGVYVDVGVAGFVAVMVLFSFFWNAVLPLYEAVTMAHVNNNHALYSWIRLWGSVGFIVLSVGVGWYIQQDASLDSVPHAFLACLVGVALCAMSLNKKAVPAPEQSHEHASVFSVLTWPLVAFLVACLLMQFSHGAYYTFFSIYLTQYDYSDAHIGLFWGAAVLAEVVAFLFMKPLLNRFSVQGLLVSALVITAVRWMLLSCLQTSPLWVVITQLMHAASFGTFHAASIVVVHKLFPASMQGRGQALYASFSFGVGGAIGAYVSGCLWDPIGGNATFYLSGVVALLGAGVAWIGMRPVRALLNVRAE